MIINRNEMNKCISNLTIATLGPIGTSSEYVAIELASRIGIDEKKIFLYNSYEEAFEIVKKGEKNLLLVANAYNSIHNFYMENKISLIGSFIKETPLYGIASKNHQKKDFLLDNDIKIVSHHAPKSMINIIKKEFDLDMNVIDCLSTSEAARLVNEEKYKYCLTNEKAKKEYNLNFILPIKPITMVWSLFGDNKYIATFDLLNKMNKFN